ncbi:hypothetical protein Vretimale_12637 [Volvox reticuliferus]|uniref:Uncharacterized protein n=1 Tax=Volvox reticuliferus TaxID=1737510 RepID=A0A8J4LTG8_9CHLO|nr:hypothetical protein Vretifemale_198 [Volvox reticuliferus]GIM08616.1 hypothetical protein Vretimale_12637 [Volvox reticuliferus]
MERDSLVISTQPKKKSMVPARSAVTGTHQTEDFQAQLGTESSAVCLLCDCGARYLIQDTSARRRIRGDSTHNVPDKEVNKEIAEELAARGIAKVLVPSPSVRRH